MQQYCKITHNEDECFVDFSFDIINIKRKLLGRIILECAACDDGKNVGFCLEIKKICGESPTMILEHFALIPKA